MGPLESFVTFWPDHGSVTHLNLIVFTHITKYGHCIYIESINKKVWRYRCSEYKKYKEEFKPTYFASYIFFQQKILANLRYLKYELNVN